MSNSNNRLKKLAGLLDESILKLNEDVNSKYIVRCNKDGMSNDKSMSGVFKTPYQIGEFVKRVAGGRTMPVKNPADATVFDNMNEFPFDASAGSIKFSDWFEKVPVKIVLI